MVDMSTASQLLDIAEGYDSYCRTCRESPLNALARKNCVYKASGLDAEHAKRLTTLVANIDLLRDTDTIVLSSSADNGYPHTRPRALICMPAHFITSSSDSELKETLCHEAMHVHQRKYPELWKTMCTAQGWKPLEKGSIPVRFREKCRINPDTFFDIQFWSWDTYHVPLPMFKRDINITLGDVSIQWLDLRTGSLFHSPPESFVAKYGEPSQPEHPYEIYAVIFTKEGISTHQELTMKLLSLSQ